MQRTRAIRRVKAATPKMNKEKERDQQLLVAFFCAYLVYL